MRATLLLGVQEVTIDWRRILILLGNKRLVVLDRIVILELVLCGCHMLLNLRLSHCLRFVSHLQRQLSG
jgi:hypothetical protein